MIKFIKFVVFCLLIGLLIYILVWDVNDLGIDV